MDETFTLQDRYLHLDAGLGIGDMGRGDGPLPEATLARLTGRLLSVFAYEQTWNWRERHPSGEELVMLLDGRADLLLDQGDGERVVPLTPGRAAIVPTGAWHRAAVHAPSTLLFVTPEPACTEHEAVAPVVELGSTHGDSGGRCDELDRR
jgi:mannose-6-phosphate isomerase-like protein (cupin superfamily)